MVKIKEVKHSDEEFSSSDADVEMAESFGNDITFGGVLLSTTSLCFLSIDTAFVSATVVCIGKG